MNIEELKRLALDSKAWYDAGAVITDPYDTYPCELFDAAVDATVVLELISQIERLKADAELFAKHLGFRHIGLKLARKDALIRRAWSVIRWQCFGECRTPGVAGLPTAAEVEDEIKTELGEV